MGPDVINASEQQCDCGAQGESFSLFGFQAKINPDVSYTAVFSLKRKT